MTALEDLVRACEDRRRLADATARKDVALWRLVREDGRTAQQAAEDAEAALRDAGFSEDDIRRAGVSFASVRAAVRRPPQQR